LKDRVGLKDDDEILHQELKIKPQFKRLKVANEEELEMEAARMSPPAS
jgi:hypothetical protein